MAHGPRPGAARDRGPRGGWRALAAILFCGGVLAAATLAPATAASAATDPTLQNHIVTNPIPGWTPAPPYVAQQIASELQSSEGSGLGSITLSGVGAQLWSPAGSQRMVLGVMLIQAGEQIPDPALAAQVGTSGACQSFASSASTTNVKPAAGIPGGYETSCTSAEGTFTFVVAIRGDVMMIVFGVNMAVAQIVSVGRTQFGLIPPMGFDVGPYVVTFDQQPTTTRSNGVISPAISVHVTDHTGDDAPGQRVTLRPHGFTFSSGVLSQTTDEHGVATFTGLHVQGGDQGLTVTAVVLDSPNATSVTFGVGSPPGAGGVGLLWILVLVAAVAAVVAALLLAAWTKRRARVALAGAGTSYPLPGALSHGPTGATAYPAPGSDPSAYNPSAYNPSAYGPSSYGAPAYGPSASGPSTYGAPAFGASPYGAPAPAPSWASAPAAAPTPFVSAPPVVVAPAGERPWWATPSTADAGPSATPGPSMWGPGSSAPAPQPPAPQSPAPQPPAAAPAPAGWRQAGDDPHRQSYWDGSAWTAHVRWDGASWVEDRPAAASP